MLEEVFIIIAFSGYFHFNKNMKTNRINKMAALIFGMLNCP